MYVISQKWTAARSD